MTLRVEPRRPDLSQDPPPDAAGPPPLPRESPPARDADALTHADNLRRFVDATQPEKTAGAQAGAPTAGRAASSDTERTDRLRAFFDRFDVEVPVLAGEPGETRRVAVPFRMSHDDTGARYRALLDALGAAPSRIRAGLVVAGRGTPEQIAAIVNDLAVRHPEAFALDRAPEQVRDYLRSLGVGIDCAGSVQLALFASRGLTPDAGKVHFGLRERVNEDLTLLANNPRFGRVLDPADLRPSDLIILHPPSYEKVGHTVIVTDRKNAELTAAEAKTLAARYPAVAVAGKPVVKVSVASSFGREGPQERTWVYDPATGSWGDLGGTLFDDAGGGRRTSVNVQKHSGPWDHPIEGMYHAK
jgi:hypothetical protein